MKTSLTNFFAAMLAAGGLTLLASVAFGQVEVPKVEAPKVDPPKVEAPAPDLPDAPKPDAPKPDAPKADLPPPAPEAPPAPRPDAPNPKPALDPARDNVRDATRDARDNVRDATRDARDAARDGVDTGREAVRDAAGTARDVTRDVRDTAREVRDTARDVRNDVRGARADLRGGANVGANVGARAGVNGNFRGPDIGLWLTPSNNYLLINDVATTGPIARLGFRSNDYIMSVNGQRVANETDFIRNLHSANGRVQVVVWRGGQQQVVWVEPAVLFQEEQVAVDPLENFGVVIDDRYPNQLIVWRVIPRSPAFYAGIRAGDTLVAFNNRPIANVRGFTTMLQGVPAGDVAIQVNRNRQLRTLNANLQANVGANVGANAGARGEVREALRPDLNANGVGPVEERAEARVDRREDRIDRNANPAVDTPAERRLDRIDDRDDRREEIRAGVDPTAVNPQPTNVNPAPATRVAPRRPRLFGR